MIGSFVCFGRLLAALFLTSLLAPEAWPSEGTSSLSLCSQTANKLLPGQECKTSSDSVFVLLTKEPAGEVWLDKTARTMWLDPNYSADPRLVLQTLQNRPFTEADLGANFSEFLHLSQQQAALLCNPSKTRFSVTKSLWRKANPRLAAANLPTTPDLALALQHGLSEVLPSFKDPDREFWTGDWSRSRPSSATGADEERAELLPFVIKAAGKLVPSLSPGAEFLDSGITAANAISNPNFDNLLEMGGMAITAFAPELALPMEVTMAGKAWIDEMKYRRQHWWGAAYSPKIGTTIHPNDFELPFLCVASQ